ncbi:MAG: SigB/SigF/SigG family RNA polymerase sigma factor [Clostridia bacterium]|nr:SigB/SigF/SigG family RNA polymerase sigma factor [Clostridia bacterium]
MKKGQMLDEKSTIEYLRRAKTGDGEAKEALIEHNVSLVKCIVKRYLGKGVDYDDLFQIACMGFLKAIAGFDESYGVKFSTYAVPMIAGEIKRFMRDDGSVKVSRSMKQTAKEMNAFVEEYVREKGVQPSVSTIAEKFGMDAAEAVFVMGSSKMPVSLQSGAEYKDGNQRELIDTLPADDDQEDWLDKMLLRGAIEDLPERDKKIIMLRYFRDMTQSEVAEKIGVSQVQVSRIENRIIKEFRQKLTG